MVLENTLARRLAPEDIRAGLYVAPLHYIAETDAASEDGDVIACASPQRRMCLPSFVVPAARVAAVCLPYVLVKHPDGTSAMLDSRQIVLARLDNDFGKVAFRAGKPRRRRGRRDES